jgi:hypothetical protein
LCPHQVVVALELLLFQFNYSTYSSGVSAKDTANKKRQALTGQWRTPPLPVFPVHQQHHQPHSTTTMIQPTTTQPPPPEVVNMTLPESTHDYAKALQEAYRRGAEAAAAMQAQQMPNAVSCPNFHQLPLGTATDPTVAGGGGMYVQSHHHVLQQQEELQHQQQQPVMLVPNPLTSSNNNNNNMSPPTTLPHESGGGGGRSFSLPDMASYAARAQVEEEKRKKRLARNRASARLRRLRKKNLVRTV